MTLELLAFSGWVMAALFAIAYDLERSKVHVLRDVLKRFYHD